MASGWAGAVLTGGASTRMGRDKAAIEVHGEAMAWRVARALRDAGAVHVALVGGPLGDVPDEHPGEGPLGGVLTALRWSPEPVVVVAPCDLVQPDSATFAALAAGLGDAHAAVPSRDRPLPVAVRVSAAGPLAEAFASGERSLRRALAGLPLAVIPVERAALADADTPADLPWDG